MTSEMLANEMVILVDTLDQQIGLAEKIHAHRCGLLHRAFSVFILRAHGQQTEVLLQQRSAEKYHCGALWTNTCCSHPRAAEDLLPAAQRRLREEMGLEINLQLLDSFIYRAELSNGLIEHEYDYVLIGDYNDAAISYDKSEVQAYRWVSLGELQQNIQDHPEIYTPWLQPALNIVIKHLETQAGLNS